MSLVYRLFFRKTGSRFCGRCSNAAAMPRRAERPSRRGPAGSAISGSRTWPGASRRRPPCLPSGPRWRTSTWNSAPLEADALGERRLVGAVDALLGHHDRRQRHGGDLVGDRRWPRRAGRPPARRARRGPSARPRRRPSCGRSGTCPSPWTCRRSAVRRCVPPAPGMTPSLISGWPNFAVSAAMMMSHIMASSQPPPSAIAGDRGDDRLARPAMRVPARR